MTKLPNISGEALIRALRKDGFWVARQKVSHVRPKKKAGEETVKLTVPLHSALKKGTLNRILKEAGLTADELKELF